MINKVILTGRLTQDVELRNTNDGTPYTFFTIAVNRRNNDQADFISCIAWRQTAELMKNYLNKGSLIGVEGRLEVFNQQKDGQYESRTTVQVSNITFLESKAQADARTAEQNLNSGSNPMPATPAPMTFAGENNFDQTQTTPAPQPTAPAENNSFGSAESIDASDINLEEIKF